MLTSTALHTTYVLAKGVKPHVVHVIRPKFCPLSTLPLMFLCRLVVALLADFSPSMSQNLDSDSPSPLPTCTGARAVRILPFLASYSV